MCVPTAQSGLLQAFEGLPVNILEVDPSPLWVVPRSSWSREALTRPLHHPCAPTSLQAPGAPGPLSPPFRRDVLEEPTEEELVEKLSRHPHLQLCR